MNVLKKTRVVLAIIFITSITLLFLDYTGTIHKWLDWTAKIQFMPALLAINIGVIILLCVLTLLFGRIYCSAICPLGIFQDIVLWFSNRRKKKKYRFSYAPAINWLRYGMLAIFIIAFIAGIGSVVALLDPYSSYGLIASNLFAPVYQWINNLLAYFAERADSYAFYSVDVWMKSLPTFIVAVVIFITVIILPWLKGRIYCNTICPVGTILGLISRFSFFRPTINAEKCNSCGLCDRICKAQCINPKEHKIDYSRCVTCMDCIDNCSQKAITYQLYSKKKAEAKVEAKATDESKRNMLTVSAALLATSLLKAQEKKVDGGLAYIEDKKIPERQMRLVPAGSQSLRNFSKHCIGCQLCVSVCPNQVLRPSTNLLTLLQPEMSYERGYCRPECNKCSEVCPAGAIKPISIADKSSTQIGHAVWIEKNCIVLTDNVECGNCVRHCPSGAITMLPSNPEDESSLKTPVVNEARCIGCGACENLCPARPFSAIYVEGHNVHKEI